MSPVCGGQQEAVGNPDPYVQCLTPAQPGSSSRQNAGLLCLLEAGQPHWVYCRRYKTWLTERRKVPPPVWGIRPMSLG